MATLFKGLDRNQTPAQKLRIVERELDRVRKAQVSRDSKYMRSLLAAATSLRAQEKQTRKGLHLTKQAYSR